MTINVKRVGLSTYSNNLETVVSKLNPSNNRLLFTTTIKVRAKVRSQVIIAAECDRMAALHEWKQYGFKPMRWDTFVAGTSTIEGARS